MDSYGYLQKIFCPLLPENNNNSKYSFQEYLAAIST